MELGFQSFFCSQINLIYQIFIIKDKKIMMTKIKIKNVEYELKYTVRVLFVYERITGKSFDPTKLFDLYMYFYSCLVANNQNFNLLVDEFIDECDNNPGIFEEFLNFFQRAIQFQNQTASKQEVTEDDNKKKE